MFGPGEKRNELTLNEEIEILEAEIKAEYPDTSYDEYDEYNVVGLYDY